MNIKWQVKFKSLRAGTDYTVNIYDQTYTGSPIRLKGGAQPFVTEEDSDDDPFTPIRIQTGHLRIVDDGYAADGVTPFDWKQFLPSSDRDRPVTLTTGTSVVWQGFLQAQDFSGELYGNPQERDFPIHCGISVLSGIQPVPGDMGARNFAHILTLVIAAMETGSGSVLNYDTIYVQGSSDAQQWLLKRVDWMNFFDEGDGVDEFTPQYSLYEILEDMCRFWGWTCRIHRKAIYLTRPGDPNEQKWLRLNRSQLNAIAAGSVAGATNVSQLSATINGDVFASVDNEDIMVRGYSQATVKSECNEQTTIVEFAPEVIRKVMDAGGYTWVAGEEPQTGYFTTPTIRNVESTSLKGTSNAYGGFCRRQIFGSPEDMKATECDMFVFKAGYGFYQNIVQIQTKHKMPLGDGSLKLSGDIYNGWHKAVQHVEGDDFVVCRIGIGVTYDTAKWFYLYHSDTKIYWGWGNGAAQSRYYVPLVIKQGKISGVGLRDINYLIPSDQVSEYIPVFANMYGCVFIDFLGFFTNESHPVESFEIANFKIEYSRDQVFLPGDTAIDRPRVMNKPNRQSSAEYTAFNANSAGDNWNSDNILASDNNMKYGYGIIINPDNSYMEKAIYNGKEEHPEQHQADRVAQFWNSPKRKIIPQVRNNLIATITPNTDVTIDNTVCHPIATSTEWRDDIDTITLIQV
jgi:hypothetical protein